MKITIPVLEAVEKFNVSRFFESHINNRGIALYYKNAVSNVSIINEGFIKANVLSGDNYKLEIEFKSDKTLNFQCDCQYRGYCKHLAALINYIKVNKDTLEFDYLSTIKPNNMYQSTIGFITTYKKIINSYYSDQKMINKLARIIISNSLELINFEKSIENFNLFFAAFDIFSSENYYDNETVAAIEKLVNEYARLNNSPTKEYLKSWQKYVRDKDINNIYDAIILNMLVSSEEEARGFIEFINYTIELIKSNNFYYKDTIELVRLKNEYIDKFCIVIISLLDKYFDQEKVYDFIKNNAIGNESVEKMYFDYLLKANNSQEILEYIEKNDKVFSYGLIIYKSIQLDKKTITEKEYKNDICNIFKKSPALENFSIIMKVSPKTIFDEIKEILFKTAKKASKDIYYEMEIYLDSNNAYDLIKTAGIFVFNKHCHHYIETKEEEIVLYYQDELIKYFRKHKNFGTKFYEIMAAVKNLTKMNNGAYYLFSVYRSSIVEYNDYENTYALDYLYDYIKTLKL